MYSKFFNILLKIVSPLCKNILINFFFFENYQIEWLFDDKSFKGPPTF